MTIRVSLTTSFAFLPQSSQSFLGYHGEKLQFLCVLCGYRPNLTLPPSTEVRN